MVASEIFTEMLHFEMFAFVHLAKGTHSSISLVSRQENFYKSQMQIFNFAYMHSIFLGDIHPQIAKCTHWNI